jgi:uncharacterized metal-binding protein YceD (DUF177 family)
MMEDRSAAKSALHYPVSVDRLPVKGLTVTLDADDREKAALAAAHGLDKVNSFHAELYLAPWKKQGVRVRGTVRASITQACVVTLEPIDSVVEETVDAVYVPERSRLARVDRDDLGELVLDPEGPDMPETFSGDKLDTGEIAEEFFELGIDPYPRKEGVELPEDLGEKEGESEAPRSPFADLAKLKSKP